MDLFNGDYAIGKFSRPAIRVIFPITFSVLTFSFTAQAVEFENEGLLMSYGQTSDFLVENDENPTEVFKYCCQHRSEDGTGQYVSFELDEAWFLKIDLDRYVVVELDLEGTCKTSFWGDDRTCTEDEIREDFKDREAKYQGIPGWYGKYHNA